MKKHLNAVKQLRRFYKEKNKKQLLYSLVYDENINNEDLGVRVDIVRDCQEAMKIIKECENITKANKKKIICFAYEQGKIFK